MTEAVNLAAEAAKATELSNAMVIGLGIGTVFIGLICLIVICYIMGAVCNGFKKDGKQSADNGGTNAPAQSGANQPIANKQEVLAACCAVIAEELGTEANNIKVLSFKRV